ncbi:Cytochrome b561 [bacterium HR40]|nr:Cytochrome b561 [bacterium HR40]
MSDAHGARGYGPVAIALHWSVAALILANLAVGWIGEEMERSPEKFTLFHWHMSLGLLVLLLSAVRLAWRWVEPPPPPLTRMPFEVTLARTVHGGLLAISLLGPITGIAAQLAEGRPIAFFGIELVGGRQPPRTVEPAASRVFVEEEGEEEAMGAALAAPPSGENEAEEEANEIWQGLHAALVKPALILLLLLHLGGALKHHFVDRDDTLARMLGRLPARASAVSGPPVP